MIDDEKNILLITTGGTILSKYDNNEKVIRLEANEKDALHLPVDDLEHTNVETFSFTHVPGPHLTPSLAVEMATKLEEFQKKYDGIVVLQGTDTLEEFSYLVSLITEVTKPIVFTGAMKSNNEYYSDGLGNIMASIRVAREDKAMKYGVLVVFNENIYTPDYMTKTHTSDINAFQAPGKGPIGSVLLNQVYFNHSPQALKKYQKSLNEEVELFKVTLGSSPNLLDKCIDMGIKGVVIEGFGAGNIPPTWVPSIKKAIEHDIPVVITSRCIAGQVNPTYHYEGGGSMLQELGAIFAKAHSGPKAKLKLMILLGQLPSLSVENVRIEFEPNRDLMEDVHYVF